MVRWVIGSIPHGGPFELFLVPAGGVALWNSNLSARVVRSIPHGGLTEVFFIPAGATQLHIRAILVQGGCQIPYGAPIDIFLFPASAPQLMYGMCYPVYVMVQIKEPMNGGCFLSLSVWSLTICPTPYNCK